MIIFMTLVKETEIVCSNRDAGMQLSKRWMATLVMVLSGGDSDRTQAGNTVCVLVLPYICS